eukprot:10354894-Lingulodinium_polyedra.AAC.1
MDEGVLADEAHECHLFMPRLEAIVNLQAGACLEQAHCDVDRKYATLLHEPQDKYLVVSPTLRR